VRLDKVKRTQFHLV